jgi:hypothetical protein
MNDQLKKTAEKFLVVACTILNKNKVVASEPIWMRSSEGHYTQIIRSTVDYNHTYLISLDEMKKTGSEWSVKCVCSFQVGL